MNSRGMLMGAIQFVVKTGGRKAVPAEVKAARGSRVKALRDMFGWTQQAVADASENRLVRTTVVTLEKGDKLSSLVNIQGLAAAFGLTSDALQLYLAGEVPIAATLVSSPKWRAKEASASGQHRAVTTEDVQRIENLEDAIAILGDYPGFTARIAVEMRGEYSRMRDDHVRSIREWVDLGKSRIAGAKGKAIGGHATAEFDELPAKKRK